MGRHRRGRRRARGPVRAAAGDPAGRRRQPGAPRPGAGRLPPPPGGGQQPRQGHLRGPQHRDRGGQGGDRRVPGRRRPARAGLGGAAARAVRRPRGDGGRRQGGAGLAGPTPGPPGARARLGRGVHLRGDARRPGRRAQRDGLQHVDAPHRLRRRRHLRRVDRADRAGPARLRRDRALHPAQPDDSRTHASSSCPRRSSTTGSPGLAPPGATCGRVPTPRVCPRR